MTDANADPDYRLPYPGVSSVLEYNDSLVLISGFSTIHVFNRNRETLTRIKNEKVMAGYIADLTLDRSGNVWVSTTSGLYRVNIRNSTMLKFGRSDGIDDEYFVLGASYTLSDGRMLFGSSETFVVFDPAAFNKIESARPEAAITVLQVNNRPVPVDSLEEAGALRLRYHESSLYLEFSTLQFYRSHSIRYKMEGLDQDWQVNENNLAVYSYLPAGTYRFLIQPVYADGTLGPIKSLDITRNPPFWRAWWFYSLIMLAVGGIIYLFDRERMRRKRSVQQMRTKIADNLHAEIRTALNSIHILSEMATIKARKDLAKAADYLGQINSKSQQMMHSMDDILWSVAPENDSMSSIVKRIEEYVHKLRSGGHPAVDLLVDKEVGELELDMRLRQMLLRLVKESIDGLLRAGAHSLQVHLGRDKTQLSFVIEFDKAETDATLLNNFLLTRDMTALSTDLGAIHQLEMHQTKGVLSFSIPVS
jgi:signal transduction histidine kinase